MTGPHWKPRTDELRANAARSARSASEVSTDQAARAELLLLRDENERWRIKFTASQLVAGQQIRLNKELRAQLADMTEQRDNVIYERDTWAARAVTP
jgi:hypothetical protein